MHNELQAINFQIPVLLSCLQNATSFTSLVVSSISDLRFFYLVPRVERGRLLWQNFNPLHAELHAVCHLLALLGTHHIFKVSGLRVKHMNDVDK